MGALAVYPRRGSLDYDGAGPLPGSIPAHAGEPSPERLIGLSPPTRGSQEGDGEPSSPDSGTVYPRPRGGAGWAGKLLATEGLSPPTRGSQGEPEGLSPPTRGSLDRRARTAERRRGLSPPTRGSLGRVIYGQGGRVYPRPRGGARMIWPGTRRSRSIPAHAGEPGQTLATGRDRGKGLSPPTRGSRRRSHRPRKEEGLSPPTRGSLDRSSTG